MHHVIAERTQPSQDTLLVVGMLATAALTATAAGWALLSI